MIVSFETRNPNPLYTMLSMCLKDIVLTQGQCPTSQVRFQLVVCLGLRVRSDIYGWA